MRNCLLALLFLAFLTMTSESKIEAANPGPVPRADLEKLAKANNEFALLLYRRAQAKAENLVCSPYSISYTLAMAYAGARGQTAEEIARTLRFPFGQEQLHPAFTGLTRDLCEGARSQNCQLAVDASVWGQKGQDFQPEFGRSLKAIMAPRPGKSTFVRAPRTPGVPSTVGQRSRRRAKSGNFLPRTT